MPNTSKKLVSIIGIIVGVIIIIIGFSLQDTSSYSIGKSIKFGADFYTEMYDVTKDVGRAINNAINDLICAISWLIISLGAIDICFFVYKLVKASEKSDSYVAVVPVEENAKREAEENVRRETEEKARCEAEEKARRQSKPIELVPMNQPKNFSADTQWKDTISKLSTTEIVERYNDADEWNESYRYLCYLELKNRNITHYAVDIPVTDDANLKLTPSANGYVCPACSTVNSSLSVCNNCGYIPSVIYNKSDSSDVDYINVVCPKCNEKLSFLKDEQNAVCPWCETKITL